MGKFRLRTLNFKLYNVNYKIDFFNKGQELSGKDKFYTTLILGPNGTGKSIVLSTIQKIFLDMYLLSISRKENHAKDIEYELIYTIGENKFKLLKENGKTTFYKNDLKISLKEIVLPERVISCAFNVEDRFSTTSAKVLEEYQYLGLKNKKFKYLLEYLTSNIIDAVLTDNKFLNDLKNVTEFLGFGAELKIRLSFKGNNSLEDMRNNIYVKKLLTNANEKSIVAADIIAFWKKYRTYNLVDSNNKTINYIENGLEIFFDFSRSVDYEEMYEDFDEIKKQIKLGVFAIPDIEMKKNGKWFSIEGSSSGEFQYLSTMINILTKIKSKSLILIDEPETSLHPNWQYKYMSVLAVQIYVGFGQNLKNIMNVIL
ncbi:ATP-binding protein [Lysinibacillus sp. JK80]|uniref:AAA family ATPase n=1 Tax=Lysinibacillus sp. JK80 TaxID=2749809 RepID=UPI0022B99FD1|nr:AAA family ATPase [Lysinibacillus sp. JK80]WBF57659.1 ATP-binding protein [Lysinibacillus sp. JK80]